MHASSLRRVIIGRLLISTIVLVGSRCDIGATYVCVRGNEPSLQASHRLRIIDDKVVDVVVVDNVGDVLRLLLVLRRGRWQPSLCLAWVHSATICLVGLISGVASLLHRL